MDVPRFSGFDGRRTTPSRLGHILYGEFLQSIHPSSHTPYPSYHCRLSFPQSSSPRIKAEARVQTLASLASHRSNCMKRRVGALLVRSKRILSTGYNGTPRGTKNCNHGGCRRCNGTARGGESCTSIPLNVSPPPSSYTPARSHTQPLSFVIDSSFFCEDSLSVMADASSGRMPMFACRGERTARSGT